MEFFDRYFHIPLPIVTKHELGFPFLTTNLHINFGANPSTIFLVTVVTDRHTDRQTNAGELKFKDFSRTFKDPQISFSRTNSRRKFISLVVEQQYLMFIYVTMVQ